MANDGKVKEKNSLEKNEANTFASILLPLLIIITAIVWKSVIHQSLHPVLESTTTIDGIDFPGILEKQLKLVGGGTRKKFGLAKVYAAGIYVDKRDGWKDMAELLEGKQEPDAKFYATVAKSKYNKAILLQFHRQVDANAVAEALEEALSTRMNKASLSGFATALRSVLPSGDVPKGMQISLTCKGSLAVATSLSGTKSFTLRDKTACPAIFDVYIGKKPVSQDIKDGFGAAAVSKTSK